MDEMQRPIGVFDSGVGGISVLRELVALMPNENFIFYGDSKNAPYGTKTLEEVRKLTLADAEYLRSRNVKALVVACNTATSAAIHILREKYQKEIPVIGIEPALKPAVSVKENSRVLVMATPMTLREKKFHNLMQKFQDGGDHITAMSGACGIRRARRTFRGSTGTFLKKSVCTVPGKKSGCSCSWLHALSTGA